MTDDKNEPVGIGVLGCANVAARRVLPAITSVDSCRLVAIASRDVRRAMNFATRHGAEVADDYRSLLDRQDVDAVYLPLPPGLHAEWIGRALRAGKHVLAEKPLTLCSTDTEQMFELASQFGLVLRENFMFCHHPMHRLVRQMVNEGAIGELRSFSSVFSIPQRPVADIRYNRGLGGGALYDVAGYPLRAAQIFLGPDLIIRGATLRGDSAAYGVDLGGAALLARPDGVTASLTFGLDDSYRSFYSLAGSTGRIEVDHVFTPPADYVPMAYLTTANGTERIPLPACDQFRAAVQAFVSTLRGEPSLPEWEPEATILQANLLDRIRAVTRAA